MLGDAIASKKKGETLWRLYSLIKYLWLAAMCTDRSTLMDIYVNTSRHPGTQRFLQCQLGVLWPQHKVNNLQKYLLPNKMAMVKILIISYDIMMIYHIINIILQCHPGTQRSLLCQLGFLWPQLLPIITENPRLAKIWK